MTQMSTVLFILLMEKGCHWLLRSWAPVISIHKWAKILFLTILHYLFTLLSFMLTLYNPLNIFLGTSIYTLFSNSGILIYLFSFLFIYFSFLLNLAIYFNVCYCMQKVCYCFIGFNWSSPFYCFEYSQCCFQQLQ